VDAVAEDLAGHRVLEHQIGLWLADRHSALWLRNDSDLVRRNPSCGRCFHPPLLQGSRGHGNSWKFMERLCEYHSSSSSSSSPFSTSARALM
jgi:hypothetical protein